MAITCYNAVRMRKTNYFNLNGHRMVTNYHGIVVMVTIGRIWISDVVERSVTRSCNDGGDGLDDCPLALSAIPYMFVQQ